MTDPNYYKRRQDIIAAAAREDFDSASRALYKILIHSIEVDDPHVLSYSFVKTALAILANGPSPTPLNRKYIEKDGTITLDGADKFCNYATTAICLLYTTLLITESTDEDVNAAKLVMLSLFGSRASVEHVRSRCFLLIFDVKPGNVIHWRGDLFADLAEACTRRNDPVWELDCLMQMITQLRRKLHETEDRLWSENRAHNEEVRHLHEKIHKTVQMEQIYDVVMLIKGHFCQNGTPSQDAGNAPRKDMTPRPKKVLTGGNLGKHERICNEIVTELEEWRKECYANFVKNGGVNLVREPSMHEIYQRIEARHAGEDDWKSIEERTLGRHIALALGVPLDAAKRVVATGGNCKFKINSKEGLKAAKMFPSYGRADVCVYWAALSLANLGFVKEKPKRILEIVAGIQNTLSFDRAVRTIPSAWP